MKKSIFVAIAAFAIGAAIAWNGYHGQLRAQLREDIDAQGEVIRELVHQIDTLQEDLFRCKDKIKKLRDDVAELRRANKNTLPWGGYISITNVNEECVK